MRITTLIILAFPVFFIAQEVRPILDDIGYPWTQESVQALTDYMEKEGDYSKNPASRIKNPVAGIVPHDDYLYSAPVGYPLFRMIRVKEVIIFGVTHSSPRKFLNSPKNKIILDRHLRWKGPLGEIQVSPLRNTIIEQYPVKDILISSQAHQKEHSIEAVLPFLQAFNPSIQITPIMVSDMDFPHMTGTAVALSKIISDYMQKTGLILGEDLFILISCDATHYGSDFKHTPYGSSQKGHDLAVEEDRKLVEKYLTHHLEATKINGFVNSSSPMKPSWCGRFSVPLGLLTVQKLVARHTETPLNGTLIKYSDSYSGGALPVTGLGMGTTAPFNLNHWVGYFSILYGHPD